MRVTVSAWDPAYADSSERGGETTQPKLDVGIEVAADRWRPLDSTAPAPARVLLVDGVRRLDARIDVQADGHGPVPGICASYAAGVVVCDLSGERPGASVVAARVERGLFSASDAGDMTAGRVAVYRAHRVRAGEPGDLVNAVQDRLAALEVSVTTAAEPREDDLLIVDGTLRRRAHVPRAVGFIKSHQRRYLPEEQSRVVDALEPGQRTPVFKVGTSWARHSWYLRLPGGGDGPWGGMARLECAAESSLDQVTALADLSTAVLPRLASAAHKDPRAPQNLTPIAGLERALRAKLGDPRLLLRGLRLASRA